MVRTVPDARAHDDALRDWLGRFDIRLDQLRDFHLPPDAPFDFTPASLAGVEQVVVARLGDTDPGFLEGVVAYLGETLMRIAGGEWRWVAGRPEVSFDPALGLPGLAPEDLVGRAGGTASGNEFAAAAGELAAAVAARLGFEPTKVSTAADPLPEDATDAQWVAQWVGRQTAAFAEWACGHLGTWDFSPASLDRLEEAVLATVPAGEIARHRAFADLAAWYLGEVIIRAKGGRWARYPLTPEPDDIRSGQPEVSQLPPGEDATIPITVVDAVIRRRGRGRLRRRFDSYG